MFPSLIPDPTDPHAPEWGDERERSAVLAAYTRGFVISTYAAYALCILLAVFGHVVFAALTLVLVASGPSLATIADAKRRGVDLYALGARARRSRRVLEVVALTVVVLALVAIAMHLALTGHPLLPTPALDTDPLIGACIGGLCGFGIGLVLLRRRYAQAARRQSLDDEADDD